jgi:hypothetical protein
MLDLYVNSHFTTVTVADGAEPLLYVLRNQVGTPRSLHSRANLVSAARFALLVDRSR